VHPSKRTTANIFSNPVLRILHNQPVLAEGLAIKHTCKKTSIVRVTLELDDIKIRDVGALDYHAGTVAIGNDKG